MITDFNYDTIQYVNANINNSEYDSNKCNYNEILEIINILKLLQYLITAIVLILKL